MIIEPMLKPQWYVDTDDMARRACEVVKSGELKIIPEEHQKTWFRWLENSRPWCISRQLWWGHRIPAYHATIDGEHNTFDNDDEYWIVAISEEEALKKVFLECYRILLFSFFLNFIIFNLNFK